MITMNKHFLLVCSLLVAAALVMGCKRGTVISPLPAGYDLSHPQDCTVPAEFTQSDFDWRGDVLEVSVYTEDLYDAVDVHRMQVGDLLRFDGRRIVVEDIETDGSYITVNHGIEAGGACLQAHEGGTYRSVLMDGHSVYTPIGRARLTLSQDFVIHDCGIEPTDPTVTVTSGQKAYIEGLQSSKVEFSPLDTRVRIEGGRVVEINRHWIP